MWVRGAERVVEGACLAIRARGLEITRCGVPNQP